MIIAERVLKVTAIAESHDVRVIIQQPLQRDGAWFCKFEIGWPGQPSSLEVGGVDSAQALIGALNLVGAQLYASSYHREGRLCWETPGTGYGFPVPSNFRSDLIGDDKKYF